MLWANCLPFVELKTVSFFFFDHDRTVFHWTPCCRKCRTKYNKKTKTKRLYRQKCVKRTPKLLEIIFSSKKSLSDLAFVLAEKRNWQIICFPYFVWTIRAKFFLNVVNTVSDFESNLSVVFSFILRRQFRIHCCKLQLATELHSDDSRLRTKIQLIGCKESNASWTHEISASTTIYSLISLLIPSKISGGLWMWIDSLFSNANQRK